MRKWFISVLCLFLLSGCSSTVELQKQTFTIELGKDVYANPSLYVKEDKNYDTSGMSVQAVSNGIRKRNNRFVTGTMDYLVVGEYNFKLVDGNNEYPFKIKIKDTLPPTVGSSPSEITVAKETIINWADYFEASDLSGVSYSVNTNFSTSESGSFDVVVKISDRFGNAIEKSVRVNVS